MGGAQQRVLDLEAERDEARGEIERLSYRIKLLANPYQLGYKEGDAHGRKDAEAERDALRDKLSSVTEDYIKERNAATAAEAERDALREKLTKQEKYEAGAWLTVQELRAEVERLRAAVGQAQVLTGRMEGKLERAEAALKAEKVNCPWMPRALKAEAALKRAARLLKRFDAIDAALRDTAPGEEHPFAPCLKHGGPWHIFCGLLCEVCGLPAEKHTAPAEAPLASPDSVPPGVEDLRARHYERINRHAGGDDIAPTLPGCTCDDYAAHAICPVCRAQADGEP
jgi:DNA repair exonuclease SbcCD ATPase subunit